MSLWQIRLTGRAWTDIFGRGEAEAAADGGAAEHGNHGNSTLHRGWSQLCHAVDCQLIHDVTSKWSEPQEGGDADLRHKLPDEYGQQKCIAPAAAAPQPSRAAGSSRGAS